MKLHDVLPPGFTYWILEWDILIIELSDYGYQTVIFFCYRTIGISNIVLANSRNYRPIGYWIKASVYRISDSEKTIGCPPLPDTDSHKVLLTYVEYRAVSDVFQNIDPPLPSPPSECVLPRTRTRTQWNGPHRWGRVSQISTATAFGTEENTVI